MAADIAMLQLNITALETEFVAMQAEQNEIAFDDSDVPEHFFDPITQGIMSDPGMDNGWFLAFFSW